MNTKPILALALLTCAVTYADKLVVKPAAAAAAVIKDPFLVPDVIAHDVEFWSRVYREWDSHQVVFYDSVSKAVYDVINLPRLEFGLSSHKYKGTVEKKTKELESLLKNITSSDKKITSKTGFKSLRRIVENHGLLKEKNLLERLKAQNGLRSQFEYGLRMSGRYADDIKAVLRAEGVPEEALAIVFVESLFYMSAVSHAGAAGLWGLMKETALRSGIHVNSLNDERGDWVKSTRAAARYLKKSKEGLGEWPLAFTAYNYGYPGTLRAVKNLGTTDFATILKLHDSPIFKFASKNYFAEVLAAMDILRQQDKYFPGLKKEKRFLYDLVQLPRPVMAADLFATQALKREDLQRLNPGLSSKVLSSLEPIPGSYVLRVNPGQRDKFTANIKKINHAKHTQAENKISVKYQARGNESLRAIAKLFGISAEFLADKMKKPLSYRPKGTVLIRSSAYLFSPLFELEQTKILEESHKPAEPIIEAVNTSS